MPLLDLRHAPAPPLQRRCRHAPPPGHLLQRRGPSKRSVACKAKTVLEVVRNSSPWAAAEKAPPHRQAEDPELWAFVEAGQALKERFTHAVNSEEEEELRQLQALYASGTDRLVKAGEVLLGLEGTACMDPQLRGNRLVNSSQYLWEFSLPSTEDYIRHRREDERKHSRKASRSSGARDVPGLSRKLESVLLAQVRAGSIEAFKKFSKGDGVLLSGGFLSQLAGSVMLPKEAAGEDVDEETEEPVLVGNVYRVPAEYPAVQVAVSRGVHRALTERQAEWPAILWRVDKYEQNMTHARQLKALQQLTPASSILKVQLQKQRLMQAPLDYSFDQDLEESTTLDVRLPFLAADDKVLYSIAAQKHSSELARLPNTWARSMSWRRLVKKTLAELERSEGLNKSQRAAISAAALSTFTLWQGPPGTGKTKTLLCLLRLLCRARDAALGAPLSLTQEPLLACAETNAAADNIVEGLLAQGINAVRLGAPQKVRDSVSHRSIEQLTIADPGYKEVLRLREEAELRKERAQRKEVKREWPDPDIFKQLAKKLLSGLDSSQSEPYKQDSKESIGAAEKQLIEKALLIEYDQLLAKAEQLAFHIGQRIICSAQVICTTTSGAGARYRLRDMRFTAVVIDEATQATEPSVLIPIMLRQPKLVVLAGDPCQLPPTVMSDKAQELDLTVSLFERIQQTGEDHEGPPGLGPLLLNTQYRMHPTIAQFPSAAFYGGRLLSAASTHKRSLPAGFPWPNKQAHIAFVNASEGHEAAASKFAAGRDSANLPRHSKANLVEAELALRALDLILHGGNDGLTVAMLSPYRGQVALLNRELRKRRLEDKVEVCTVDSFQGREADLVIFSTVRSGRQLGFCRDRRRLNVAITRPRRWAVHAAVGVRGLIVVGRAKTLMRGEELKSWVEWMKKERCLMGMKELNKEWDERSKAWLAAAKPPQQKKKRRRGKKPKASV